MLEIGCGWGGFAERAADRGHAVTAVTDLAEPEGLCRRPARRPRRHPALRLPRHRRALPGHRLDRDDRGGRRALLADLLRDAEGPARRGRPGGGPGDHRVRTATFRSYRRGTDYIRHSTFPGGMLLCNSGDRRAGGPRRPPRRDALRLRPRLCPVTCRHVGRAARWIGASGWRRSATADRRLRHWRYYLEACAACFAVGRTDVVQVELSHV